MSLRTRDFHESYYEHSCAVVAELDVLETDIRGTSFLAKIYWDLFMLVVFMVNKLTFHHNTSFVFSDLYRSFYYIGAILELVILADLLVNLATGYIDQQTRRIVLDKQLGIMHYCSTRLFFHCASALPLQWMIFVRYGSNYYCTLCKTSRFICILGVISLLDLFRLCECSSYWVRLRSSYKVFYFLKFVRISVIGLFTMFQFIELADTVTLRVMVEQGKIEDDSFVGLLLRKRYGEDFTSDPFVFFIFDFARICKSILLFSFAYRKMIYYVDRIITLIAYMIANMFCLWTIAECYALICQMKFPDDRMMDMKNSMLNMARGRQLSDRVTAKLKKYYDFNFSKAKAIERRNHLYKTIPMVLKREQAMACYSRYIMRIPYFAEWSISVKKAIVHMMKEEIYLENDLVAEPYVQSEGLCIIAAGELVVYTSEKETGHMIDGDYFGELSLVTDREVRTSSVIALTPCLILILDKFIFRRYMRQYPDLFFKFKRHLKDKFGNSQMNQDRLKIIESNASA